MAENNYDPLPAPQFGYTEQLREYEELLSRRKRKQKWGNLFNGIAAATDSNHISGGYFARNKKKIDGAYGSSLAQESKRLTLLGKAEKEGIHQEISMRLQKATKDYSMSSKSDFDSWFETLGPHFAGEYKTYFDIWKAGVGEERAYEDQLMQEINFKQDNIVWDQDQAKLKADALTEKQKAFKDSQVDKLFGNYIQRYANYYNDIQSGTVSGSLSLNRLRQEIFDSVYAQDWDSETKAAVVYGSWAKLNLSVTGGASVPNLTDALDSKDKWDKHGEKVFARDQKAVDRKASEAYAEFVKKVPADVNDYADKYRELSSKLMALDVNGASPSKVAALLTNYGNYWKGFASQRGKIYDPAKDAPSTKVVIDWKGNRVLRTNKQIEALQGTDKEYKSATTEAVAKISAPGNAFFAVGMEMLAEGGDPEMLADLNVILNKGFIGGLNERQIKLAKEIQAKLDKLDQESLNEIFARLGGMKNFGSTTSPPIDLIVGSDEYEAARDLAIATLKDRGFSMQDGLKKLKEAGWK
tara:strand:+ start:57 stop:1631 length:1575 start_codon:yes stop_codon:yes gene_type:complete